MENISQPKWPMSWREKMDRMNIGDFIPVDAKVVKSVRYIASKHFNSDKSDSIKRFTTRRTEDGDPPTYALWRIEDVKKGEEEDGRDI